MSDYQQPPGIIIQADAEAIKRAQEAQEQFAHQQKLALEKAAEERQRAQEAAIRAAQSRTSQGR